MSSTDLTLSVFWERGGGIRALIDDFKAGRLSNAVLIVGAPGIGKKTLARLIAKGLLCTDETDRPCGVCRACKRFDTRAHPDLMYPEIAAKDKTIKVDAIRGILDVLSRHAFEGGQRVVLLENAERLTPQAQNSLLKSLEEARAGTTFLLTADRETAILPTIRSRCRVERMQPMSAKQVEKALGENGYAGAQARRAAFLCDGSVGRAQKMLSDPKDEQLRALARDTFLAVGGGADVPNAERLLKDSKDDGDALFDILEQELRAMLSAEDTRPRCWEDADAFGIAAALRAVMEARRMRASNVGWAAAAQWLLERISEETSRWQR